MRIKRPLGAEPDTMAKPLRLRAAEGKRRKIAAPPLARGRAATPAAAVAAGPAVSDPMRLAAEVARLEAELAAMRARIAEILKLEIERVSVKATTTEGMGYTGRREGLAAQAVATVRLPSGDLT